MIRDFGDVVDSRRPWIGIMPQQQTFAYEPGSSMRCVMPVLIVAHLHAATKAEVIDDVDDLHDDIIAALMVDETRGGHAAMTFIDSEQDDTGDPDSKASGTLEMIIRVIYYRTTESS